MEYELSLHLQTNICRVNLDLCASDKLGISEAERKTAQGSGAMHSFREKEREGQMGYC